VQPLARKTREAFSDGTWDEFARRWEGGDYRASLFRDMILADVRRLGPRPTLLDIGCGRGLDGEPGLQQSLAERAGRYVGIEPDAAVPVGECFTQVHRCPLEDAPLEPASIDVAFAVFVIEHVGCPKRFFRSVFDVLVDGGVFWGFTIDLRHVFALASLLAEGLGVKPWCIDCARAAGAAHHAAAYRTLYRANTPLAIRRYASRFRSVRLMNLQRTGQFDAYLPPWAHRCSHGFDRLAAALRLPGPMLVLRLEK